MLVDTDDLAGVGDLVLEHGEGHSTINFWTTQPGFPEPLVILSCGKVYSRFAVREWIVARKRARLLKDMERA